MNNDPRETLDKAPMSLLQIIIVGITCVLNGLDGFDVLSISFASPGIAAEWNIDRAALGIVLSMELIGMAIGSIAIGGVADKIGRRHTTLGCMVVMAAGMLITPFVGDVVQLSICRVFTGLGIGGVLAAINAMAAEFSNRKRRHMCVSLMSIGYPVGGIIGGIIAAKLLAIYGDWRSIFFFGAGITAFFIPVVFFFAPESVHWLVRKQPKDALKKVNAAMRRMGHGPVDSLPEVTPEAQKKSMKDLFSPGLAGITTIVTAAYFLHVTTYYFILKWVPKIVADLGFSPSEATNVLTAANIGGVIGGILLSFLTLRFDPRKLTMLVMLLGGLSIAAFGNAPADLFYMGLFAFFCGITGNTAIMGMFVIFAQAFPTHVRASGTGFCVGIGRGGAILSPILVGLLFQWEFSLVAVAAIISVGSIVGAGFLFFLKLREGES